MGWACARGAWGGIRVCMMMMMMMVGWYNRRISEGEGGGGRRGSRVEGWGWL